MRNGNISSINYCYGPGVAVQVFLNAEDNIYEDLHGGIRRIRLKHSFGVSPNFFFFFGTARTATV